MIKDIPRVGGRRRDEEGKGILSTLETIKVPIVTAHRWQKMADVSEATVRKMETELTEDTYAIAKDVAKWIEKLFQAKINPKTIDSRARRMKALSSNEESQSTPQDEKEIEENQEIKI